MRKIKFRGYNIKNQRWLYGYYLVNRGKHFVVEDEICAPDKTWEDFEVDPESVGQYVGTYMAQELYEGDVVEATETDGYKATYKGLVVYDEKNCRFCVKCKYGHNIPITGEKQSDQIGMGGYYDFYYRYNIVDNQYLTFAKIQDQAIKGMIDTVEDLFMNTHEK
jgi:uncharacterized phage protein (TIGR01671 family)